MNANENKDLTEETVAQPVVGFLTEEEIGFLDGQEPPIIIKPGPGGSGLTSDVVQMWWLRPVEGDFGVPPTRVPGTSGRRDRYVYFRSTLSRVNSISVWVGHNHFFLEVPEGTAYLIGIDY